MIEYRVSPMISNDALNALFESAWVNHNTTDFAKSLEHCACWICAFDQEQVIGFVKVAWDGALHGFILDTTVHPEYQRRGIGRKLLDVAADTSRSIGIEVLHVDYESQLNSFYRNAGYIETDARILKLS